MRDRLSRLAAAVVLTAAAGSSSVLLAAPAEAAACAGTTGVTVVVDFHQLGGGTKQECAASGGSASSMFTGTGFALTRAQRLPGFICRVAGMPADDPCVDASAADAYWALWWNDGTSTTWAYSSLGADSLRVPAGGSVAFSWSQGGGSVQPGVAPVARRDSAVADPAPSSPTTAATQPGASSPSGGRSTSSAKPTRSPKPPRATPRPSPTRAASPTPTPSSPESETSLESPTPTRSAAPTASDSPSVTYSGSFEPMGPEASLSGPSATATGSTPTSAPAPAPDDGLPTWVGPVLVVLVFGAAGAVAVVRRRRTSP